MFHFMKKQKKYLWVGLASFLAFVIASFLAINYHRARLIAVDSKSSETVTCQNTAGCYTFFKKDFDVDIPPPSLSDEQEAATLVGLKSLRTPSKLVSIREQADDPVPYFLMVAGLDPVEHKVEIAALRLALDDGFKLTLLKKDQFKRARPHTVNPDVAPVIPVPWHAAYPSGHAAQSVFLAKMLSCLKPGKANELVDFAKEVAINREIAGVHYHGDTLAGYFLGEAMWDELKSSGKFNCRPVN